MNFLIFVYSLYIDQGGRSPGPRVYALSREERHVGPGARGLGESRGEASSQGRPWRRQEKGQSCLGLAPVGEDKCFQGFRHLARLDHCGGLNEDPDITGLFHKPTP